jgi:uncharacterized protein (TIGR02246 family)
MENKKEGENSMENKKIMELAKENFSLWRNALLTKDPAEVAKLYAEDNTFLPTMSGEFKEGIEEAQEYFEHFLLGNPEGMSIEEKIQPMGDNYYSHNGLYDFEVDDENGKRIIMECRFTFNWRKDSDGKWRIIHHHSSQKPRKK